MAVVHDAFEAVVKALASTVEVEQLSGAILLRRFFDPKSEVGIGNCPYKVVNVIAASLRGQETGNFQKLLVDSLAYAPTLRHADLQRTNLQNGYLGSRSSEDGTPNEQVIVDLSYADFYRSDLSGGSIKGAIAEGATFYRSFLERGNFFEADLDGAKFDGAYLKGASFEGARNLPPSLAAKLDARGIYNQEGKFVAPADEPGTLGVFLSKTGVADCRRDQIIMSVCNCLSVENITTKTLERPDYPSFGALAEVKRLLAGCAGAVILGFRDIEISEGVWRAGTKEEVSLRDHCLATRWAQIEAGMALMAGLPVLIVSDPQIRGGVFDMLPSEHLLFRAEPDGFANSSAFQDWCTSIWQVAA